MFDSITPDDLIVAFYPCIYFCEKSQNAFAFHNFNYRKLSDSEKIEKILARSADRTEFYERLLRFVSVCLKRNLRMVFENPWTQPHYLNDNFVKKPDIIDKYRSLRGDYYKKPTAFWFFGCKPTYGFSYQKDKRLKTIDKSKPSGKAGLCSEERSLISPDYARNWICDFIIGKEQSEFVQDSMFEEAK